jgi:hypothetical protein
MLSPRCPSDLVPGIGTITGERRHRSRAAALGPALPAGGWRRNPHRWNRPIFSSFLSCGLPEFRHRDAWVDVVFPDDTGGYHQVSFTLSGLARWRISGS